MGRIMKKILLLFFTTALILNGVAAEPLQLEFWGNTDKPSIYYKTGEKIRFTLELLHKGEGTVDPDWVVKWSCRGDDGKAELKGTLPVAKMPHTIETTLDKPGFIWVTAQLYDKNGKPVLTPKGKRKIPVEYTGGAGAAIDQIKAVPEPGDFDEFWKGMKKELASVPLRVIEKKQIQDNGICDIYAMKIACAGPRPVTGYLTVPKGAKAKSMPVRAEFYGYSWRKIPVPKKTSADRITFYVSAHGVELRQNKAYYDKFFNDLKSNGHTQGLDPEDNRKPGKSFLSFMSLRVMRAMEYLKTLPEWDGKTLEANGGSQGGLQSVWAASLVPGVSRINVSIIWCCDLGGATVYGRLCAPVSKGPSQTVPWRMAYVPELGYFDAVNHAKRIPESCYVNIITAGLGDYISPPSGLALFYKNVRGKALLRYLQNAGHVTRSSIRKGKVFELKK
jgi:cephalosporin-C deacetylase-like acetyl esterase